MRKGPQLALLPENFKPIFQTAPLARTRVIENLLIQHRGFLAVAGTNDNIQKFILREPAKEISDK